MRRRLLQSTVAVAVVAVALLGVPLAVAGVLSARAAAQQAVDRAAVRIGQEIDGRIEAGTDVTEGVLRALPDGAYGYARAPDGQVFTVGETPADPIRSRYLSPTLGTVVEVQESGTQLRITQLRLVLLVLVVSVVAVGAAVALGLLQARRLAEPLDDLAARARRLGSGGARSVFPRYGVPEVDEVADALEAGAERNAAMLASERQFAQDASHQLRTPLTALSMRLEEILHTDDTETVREEARVALGQVERLSAVVDRLLTSARQSRSATARPVDVDEVVEQQVEEWSPAFAAADRRLELTGVRGLVALASPGGLPQVLATLLENSLAHGAGAVTVRTRRTGTSVVVEVADEGPGVPPELGARIFERSVSGRSSTGLGLALARDLAEADGGRLELLSVRPAVFAVFLGVPVDDDLPAVLGGRTEPAREAAQRTGTRSSARSRKT